MDKQNDLKELYNSMSEVFKSTLVFGDGNPESGVLFIGEAPGAEEIKLVTPFVGKAGKNLDSFLKSIDMDRTKCYITNSVKFRPTGISDKGNVVNRAPTWNEVKYSRPYLKQEIEILSPRIIITLGGTPAKSVLDDGSVKISRIHGTLIDNEEFNCKIFFLYHPASIIYNAGLKRQYLEDLEKLKTCL